VTFPGFNAEASLYQSNEHYRLTSGDFALKTAEITAEASVDSRTSRCYRNGVPIQEDRSINPALQFCPPRCVSDCVTNCRRDGLSLSFCHRLCLSDCSTYSSLPLSCGPCINQRQSCTLCGGQTVTELCCDVRCGDGCCPDATDSCCAGVGCCPSGCICITLPFVDPYCFCPFGLFGSAEDRASPGFPGVVPLKPLVIREGAS
jgi:hypothetical protein